MNPGIRPLPCWWIASARPAPEFNPGSPALPVQADGMLDSLPPNSYSSKLRSSDRTSPPDDRYCGSRKRSAMRYPVPGVLGVLVLTLGCQTATEPTGLPEAVPVAKQPAAELTGGFAWTTATPESQGMCGSVKVLGCTKTLQQVWNGISAAMYNTKSFVVIRN